jgi:chitosanase
MRRPAGGRVASAGEMTGNDRLCLALAGSTLAIMRRSSPAALLCLTLALAAPGCGGSDQSGGAPVPASTGGNGPGTGGSGGNPGSGGTGPSGGSSGGETGGSPGTSADGAAPTGGSVGSGGTADAGAPPRASDGAAPPAVDGGGAPPGGGMLGDPAQCDYTDPKQFCDCIHATCGGDTFKDKSGTLRSVYCGQCTGSDSCIGKASVAGGAVGICEPVAGLTPGQKTKASGLTSVWENSTPSLQYGYSQDIGDDRGFTSGRAGFCTGTGDGIIVVQCYSAAKPGNPLEKFIPELVRLEQAFVAADGDFEKAKSGDTSKLGGYTTAWKSSGGDPVFRTCQDSAVDAIYYGPAYAKGAEKHFKSPLTFVSLWDAQIMHGETDPNFGVRKLMANADAMVKVSADPTPKEESDWLGAFHYARAKIMTTRGEWRGNIYRVAVYEKLRRDGNMAFKGCVNSGSAGAGDFWSDVGGGKGPSFSVCGD